MKMPATCSSYGDLVNVLDRPQACGCTSIEYDGLTCGTVVTTTAQGHSETTNHTVEEAASAEGPPLEQVEWIGTWVYT